MENLIEEAAKGKPIPSINFVNQLYDGDLDIARLRIQIQMLPNIGEKQCNNMTEVIVAVKMALKTGGIVIQKMLSEVIILLRLYLTIPVTTATSERSFSVLRRTKNYMRTTMSQPRLTSAMLCCIHKERLDALDIDSISAEFYKLNCMWWRQKIVKN